jgi:hypothetical protein
VKGDSIVSVIMSVSLLLLTGAAEAEEDSPDAAGGARPRETADAVLNSENQSWKRTLAAALHLPAWLDLAIDHQTRFEYLEGPFRPGEPETQSQLPQRTRLRLGIGGPAPVKFLVELQDARTSGDEPGDFVFNQVDELDVLQLVVGATTRNLFGKRLRGDIHAGRMTLDLGSRRLLARNRHRNTTNAFDGVHLQMGSELLDWRLRTFVVQPVVRESGTFDDESSSRLRFYGIAYENERLALFDLDVYYLDLDDRPEDRRIQSLGARVSRPSRTSRLDFEIELMQQFIDVPARKTRPTAVHAELGYTFDAAWTPRLSAQADFASGDGEPADGDSDTFIPVFGARRFDLVVTGIFGPFVRSNIVSPGVRLSLRPAPALRAELKVRAWRLEESRGAFVGTGLQDPTGSSGRDLGTDVEVRVQWDPLPWFGIDAGYEHWFKGSYLDRVPGAASTADAKHFYLAPRVRF